MNGVLLHKKSHRYLGSNFHMRRTYVALKGAYTHVGICRIPQRLHEIGVREEDIPALAVAAFNDVCTGGNPRPTSVGDIEKLYRTAF